MLLSLQMEPMGKIQFAMTWMRLSLMRFCHPQETHNANFERLAELAGMKKHSKTQWQPCTHA